MAHSNSTPNYNLPQFLTSDKPAWLTDVNTAYADIDLAMKANSDAATTAGNNAVQALSDASTANTTATAADTKANGITASIADVFDTTSAYPVNSVVMYNSLLYKCIIAVTTPGAWTGSANWERTTVETILDSKANTSAIPTRTSQLNNDSGFLTLNDVPVRRSFNSWGTALSVPFERQSYFVMIGDRLFTVWLAGAGLNDVNIRNISSGTSASGTGSATLDGVTVVRTSAGVSITLNTSSTITAIG